MFLNAAIHGTMDHPLLRGKVRRKGIIEVTELGMNKKPTLELKKPATLAI